MFWWFSVWYCQQSLQSSPLILRLQSLCFRGKCLLTCLSGRVEVLGFTIEQGQQPYPLFSPPSHCPLTITASGDCTLYTKSKKESRLEAKAIVRKYLSSGESFLREELLAQWWMMGLQLIYVIDYLCNFLNNVIFCYFFATGVAIVVFPHVKLFHCNTFIAYANVKDEMGIFYYFIY